jgi:hypothetical protein
VEQLYGLVGQTVDENHRKREELENAKRSKSDAGPRNIRLKTSASVRGNVREAATFLLTGHSKPKPKSATMDFPNPKSPILRKPKPKPKPATMDFPNPTGPVLHTSCSENEETDLGDAVGEMSDEYAMSEVHHLVDLVDLENLAAEAKGEVVEDMHADIVVDGELCADVDQLLRCWVTSIRPLVENMMSREKNLKDAVIYLRCNLFLQSTSSSPTLDNYMFFILYRS